MTPKILCSQQNLLGECPIWHPEEQCLYWLDVFGQRLYRYSAHKAPITSIALPHLTSCIAPHKAGGLIAGMKNAIVKLDPVTAKYDVLIELFDANQPIRINDGKCDPAGRFWLGTVSTDYHQPNGNLYCFEANGTLRHMQTQVGISNGLDWDLSRKVMYYNDSGKDRCMWRYQYDISTGNIMKRKKIFPPPNTPNAIADGLTLDSEGNIWTAIWQGHCVLCLNPDGQVLQRIDFNTPRLTSCIFGGRDLKTLFVTSCAKNTEAGETDSLPYPAGNLFTIKMEVSGTPMSCFGGEHK